MPFGLHGVAATIQRLMDKVLKPVATFALAYIDDIVFSQTWVNHRAHSRAMLLQLREYGLMANPNKCHIGQVQVNYLGYIVGWRQLQAQSDKVQALKQAQCP